MNWPNSYKHKRIQVYHPVPGGSVGGEGSICAIEVCTHVG